MSSISSFASVVHAKVPAALAVAVGVGSLLGGQLVPELTADPASSAWLRSLIVLVIAILWLLSVKFLRDADVKGPAASIAPSGEESPPILKRRVAIDLPSSEHLVAQINSSIERGCGRTLLAMIELKDFERLYAFDPDAAKAILIAFSKRLCQVLGEMHLASHLGRGTFGIWFGGADADLACKDLGTISYALRSEIKTSGLSVVPDVSLKIGLYPDDGEDADTLLMKTSISKHLASENSPQLNLREMSSETSDARQRYSLEQDLRFAVERHELFLEYQPIVDLRSGRLSSVEALMRWRHPSLGLISPIKFVPLLEDMGLINDIGMWSLNTACAAMQSWQQQGFGQLTVAVNLSARQLQDPTLVVAVERTLEKHSLKPDCLTLELTETAAMLDADRTLSLFRELKEVGVNLAIDDFGTGYSSMSYLLTLPFDKLKIDRAFVTDVHVNAQRQAICRSLFELARGLEIGIIAEGAEAIEEVEMLEHIGCHLIQGFYFSRPVLAEQLPALASREFWRGSATGPLPRVRLTSSLA